jgi:hypothetical protein
VSILTVLHPRLSLFTGTGVAHVLNETHRLLMTYAASRYVLTVPGTVDQLTSWYERHAGVRVSERTFKRHTRQLADAGLIFVKHTKRRTYYTLLNHVIEMPCVKFLPTADPGQFLIAENGMRTVGPVDLDNEAGWFNHNQDPTDGGSEHRAVMASLDLDALQASWSTQYEYAA